MDKRSQTLGLPCLTRLLLGLAIPACLMIAAVKPSDASDALLTGPELKTFFVSGKLRYTFGDTVRILAYHSNGSAEQFNDDGSITKGKWKVQGSRYCTIWPSRKNWKCFGVVRMDDGRFGDIDEGSITGYFARQ